MAMGLVGCVATVRIAAPPPPPRPPPPPPAVYEPPPPPAYSVDDAAEIQASEAPPPLPDYDQPPCPEDGYIWTPGYWAFGPGGYYWVPGTWVQPPRVGVLWTPGYWGFVGAVYVWHAGYWGPHVGFYGGVHYGYGYNGAGFAGGRWVNNSFAYNRTVTNVNVTVIHNTYNETVVNNVTVNKVSYNGGEAGVHAAPTNEERQFEREPRVAPTTMQIQHAHAAAGNPALFVKANGGHPSIAATPRPAAFTAPGVVATHGALPPAPAQPLHPGPPNSVPNHPNDNAQQRPIGQPPAPVTHTATSPPRPPAPPKSPAPPKKPPPKPHAPAAEERKQQN